MSRYTHTHIHTYKGITPVSNYVCQCRSENGRYRKQCFVCGMSIGDGIVGLVDNRRASLRAGGLYIDCYGLSPTFRGLLRNQVDVSGFSTMTLCGYALPRSNDSTDPKALKCIMPVASVKNNSIVVDMTRVIRTFKFGFQFEGERQCEIIQCLYSMPYWPGFQSASWSSCHKKVWCVLCSVYPMSVKEVHKGYKKERVLFI